MRAPVHLGRSRSQPSALRLVMYLLAAAATVVAIAPTLASAAPAPYDANTSHKQGPTSSPLTTVEAVTRLFLRSAPASARHNRDNSAGAVSDTDNDGFFPQSVFSHSDASMHALGANIELGFEAFGSQYAFNMTLMPSVLAADALVVDGVPQKVQETPSYMYVNNKYAYVLSHVKV